MNQEKILNIVQFQVTNQGDTQSTSWEPMAVFSVDKNGKSVFRIVSSEQGYSLASENHISIFRSTSDFLVTPEVIVKNYQDFSKVAGFDPRKQTQSVTTPISSDNKASVINPKPRTTSKSAHLNSTKPHKAMSASRKPDSKSSLLKNIKNGKPIKEKLKTVAYPFISAYGLVGKACDWATGKIFRSKKKAKKISLKERFHTWFSVKKEAVTERTRKFADKTVAMKTLKKAKRRASFLGSRATAKNKTSQKGFLGRLATSAAAIVTPLALAFGLVAAAPVANASAKDTGSGITNEAEADITDLTDEELLEMINNGKLTLDQVKVMLATGEITNDVLAELSFDQLLQITNSDIQYQEMSKIGYYLDYFNGTFANYYVESNHPDVRAALSWEEVSALNLAYNDFTKEEIIAIFNGYEVNSADFTNAYKEGTLQLMGAFVLETRDMPVDLSQLLNTQEGQEFYQKYNELFLRCKETTGQDQIDAVNAFYQELHNDFPINADQREVGISHAETRDDIEPYKLSVTPMVAAAEIMFQNLDIDHTLSDSAIAYFNDLGLCDFAQGSFERAEQITLSANKDELLPTYQQFVDSKVQELKNEDRYFLSDRERDLSQLDLFQKWVNGHFNLNEAGEFVYGSGISQSITSTVVKTYSQSSTSYYTEHSEKSVSRAEAVSTFGEDEVKRKENAINSHFNSWNDQQKAQGEDEAEQNRQELQAEADEEAEVIREEIAKDDQDMKEDIDNANGTLAQGGTVNETDFGNHDVDFDPDYSDSHGNLNDSVGSITQDGTGADLALPDPNQTGQELDNNEPAYTNQSVSTYAVPQTTSSMDSTGDSSSQPMTNEEKAEAYVEAMAAQDSATDDVYVYTK